MRGVYLATYQMTSLKCFLVVTYSGSLGSKTVMAQSTILAVSELAAGRVMRPGAECSGYMLIIMEKSGLGAAGGAGGAGGAEEARGTGSGTLRSPSLYRNILKGCPLTIACPLCKLIAASLVSRSSKVTSAWPFLTSMLSGPNLFSRYSQTTSGAWKVSGMRIIWPFCEMDDYGNSRDLTGRLQGHFYIDAPERTLQARRKVDQCKELGHSCMLSYTDMMKALPSFPLPYSSHYICCMAFKKINGYIIHLKQILGKGSYGQVFQGQQEGSKRVCAIKVLTKKLINSDEYLKHALLQEIQILQQVKSKNIVAVYDVMESANNYYIIQELCDSDLEKYLRVTPHTSQQKAVDILKQIVNGFLSLVREGIIHRDMKPANVLISGGEMKIADFGFAKKNVTRKMKNQSAVGTPLYMSLQLLKGEPYSSKCDIWAVGFIFYQLLHHKTPWIAGSVYELIKSIEGKPLIIDPSFSPETRDFLKRTLAKTQKDRMEWDEVFAHPIFGGYFDQYLQNNKKIEDKLKVVMNGLRFKINSENIDIGKLFSLLGLNPGSELNFAQFHKFLDYISPKITEEEVRFFFDKVDKDESGTISIEEIQAQMMKHKITVDRASKLKKANTYHEDEEPPQLSEELAQRAKRCFQRLFRVLSFKKISLKKTFQAYDKQGHGNLSFECFRNMITRLDSSFTEDDIISIFDAIDIDHSKTIEFDELNAYYCKVNGLPFSLDQGGTEYK